MKRNHIINTLVEKNSYSSYLEIGVRHGFCLRTINCERKVGVDPRPSGKGVDLTQHKVDSDEFFSYNKETFDIIFIDGLHYSEQVYKDILNSLEILNEGGSIVCHDMNPTNEAMQKKKPRTPDWSGDCWKAWVRLRKERSDLSMYVVDTDWGCGVIQRGSQETLKTKRELTYKNLDENRVSWLNLITIDDFKSY
jgi:hypothetical protein